MCHCGFLHVMFNHLVDILAQYCVSWVFECLFLWIIPFGSCSDLPVCVLVSILVHCTSSTSCCMPWHVSLTSKWCTFNSSHRFTVASVAAIYILKIKSATMQNAGCIACSVLVMQTDKCCVCTCVVRREYCSCGVFFLSFF